MPNLKENHEPVGGSYHRKQRTMGKRPARVVPVGAWVELEPHNCGANYAAILCAEEEEQRILRAQAEKQAKLDRFRRDVKQRVRQLQQAKKQDQLQQSFHAVELESNIVQQSSHAAERSTPKKDWCLYRHDNEAFTIGQSSDHVTSGSESEREVDCHQLTERAQQVHSVVTRAKHSLAAKQMFHQQTNLPGGSWGNQYSRDTMQDPSQANEQEENLESRNSESDTRIPQQPIEELSSYGEMDDQRQHESHDVDSMHRLAGVPVEKTVTFARALVGKTEGQRVQRQVGTSDELSTGHLISSCGDVNDMQMRSRSMANRSHPKRHEKGHVNNMQIRTVPELRPGVQAEENKRRMGSQYSMYRRLFMDIEREQVRENIRRKDHQKNIQRLKEAKEKERRKVETEAYQSVEPRTLATGETAEEVFQRQREEQQQMEQVLQREKDRKQKSTEMNRYIRALKAMMREKIEHMGLEVPPLCACGPSIWDSNPETCANNCIFYRNPKAYAKALHSLLMSCDLG